MQDLLKSVRLNNRIIAEGIGMDPNVFTKKLRGAKYGRQRFAFTEQERNAVRYFIIKQGRIITGIAEYWDTKDPSHLINNPDLTTGDLPDVMK